jgi:integrase
LDPANDRKRWIKALTRAGVPFVRLHDARHTAATLLLRANVPMVKVQAVLGHSSIQTTIDTYAHLSSEDLRPVMEALAGLVASTREAVV